MSCSTVFCSGPRVYRCSLCREIIPLGQGIQCEKHRVHKECFKCGICDEQLFQGSCSFDDGLYQFFGPMWFCPRHMMLGSGEKYELLVKKYGPPRAAQR